MAVVFVDTSALIRRYDPAEPGAARVRALLRRGSGHTPVIAVITPIEVGSAFGRKRREGLLTDDELRRLWRLFREHWRTQYQVVGLDERVRERAIRLLFAHPLRAYDVVQLASALQVQTWLAGLVPSVSFATADRRLAIAAEAEGLVVELID